MDDTTRLPTESLFNEEALQAETNLPVETEKALRETVDQLGSILSRMAEAYFAIDPEGSLLRVNAAAAAKIFNRPEEDLRGKPLWKEYPSLTGGILQHRLQAALQTGQDQHFEAPFPRGGLWFEVHAFPGKGSLEIFLHEITERKELESAVRESYRDVVERQEELLRQLSTAAEALQKSTAEQRRLEGELRQREEQLQAALDRAPTEPGEPPPPAGSPAGGDPRLENELLSVILETCPAGIAVVSSLDLIIRYANPAFRLLIPDPERDPVGFTLDEILPHSEGSRRAREMLLQVLETGEPIRTSQYEQFSPGGAQRSYEIYLNLVEWERRRAVLAILWETTGLRKAQNQAEAEAARAQDYAARLEAANRELRSFAFIASHDLQEPLRKIQVFGDRLKAHNDGTLDEMSLVFLERMQNASGRMQEMITGLLAYSRVSTHNLPFKAIDLGQIAREVLSDLEVSVERANAQVHLGELPVIEADPIQMRQLLQNLIGNALKFQRPGIPARIEITSVSAGLGRVQIMVADNGIGFDPNRAALLFQPFSRLHGRLYEGTGMGLAICRKTVERHQGSITVESSPGQGTTFYVTLPVVQNFQSK
jgi:signal transduction histidine kinase